MRKYLRFVILINATVLILITACRREARPTPEPDAGQVAVVTATPAAQTEGRGVVSTATETATSAPPTDTATPAPTPTVTPTPTSTPVPSARLETARRAYRNGLMTEARTEFDRVIQDASATPDEQRESLFWRGRSEIALGEYNIARVTFDVFTEQYTDDALTPAAYFNQALALQALGLYTDTIVAYQASVTPDSPITSYVYERMGDFALQQEQFADAVEWYSTGLNATDVNSFQVHLREGIAEAHLGLEDYDAALAQYDAILDVSQFAAYRAKITRLKGEAYLAADDRAAAQATFQEALDAYPAEYESYLGLITMVRQNMTIDEYQRGYTDYYGGRAYKPAIDAMERYLAQEPETNGDEALWVIARSWRAEGDYNQAIEAFDRLIEAYPNTNRWFEAHLERARTMGWQDRITPAIQAYRDFVAAHPDHPLSPDAAWRAALLELRIGRLDAAYENFQAVAEQYPTSDFADDALYWGGIAAYRNEKFADAGALWFALLSNYDSSDFAPDARFWQAKALLASGNTEEARAMLERLATQHFSYYGLRARDVLAADDPLAAPAPSTPLALDATEPDRATIQALQAEVETWLADWLGLNSSANLSVLDSQIQADPALIRAEMLHTFGLIAEANNEYATVLDNWSGNILALYQLAIRFKEREAYHLSMRAAQQVMWAAPEADPADMPVYIRQLVYPTYFKDLVLAWAEERNLDPALVFGLIRQESFYNTTALSSASARGLMQIIPPTGADIAEANNTPNYTVETLWLPYRNIEFGTWYLRQMLTFFDENQFAALSAYNAGPGNVSSWQPFPADFDLYVVQIPLFEPRTYIRRIYVNIGQYRDIYGVQE